MLHYVMLLMVFAVVVGTVLTVLKVLFEWIAYQIERITESRRERRGPKTNI